MNVTTWLQLYSAFVSSCDWIFLDIGSNRGMHSKFLYDSPSKWTRSVYATQLFPAFFGVHRNETCSILFEPNPRHAHRQQYLQQLWKQTGRRSMYAPFAVSGDSDSDVHFDQQLGNSRYNSDGAHIVQRGGIVVPAVSVRQLLSPVKRAKVVVMKVDIEGAEFSLFQTMIMTNLICTTVDHITAEVHTTSKDKGGILASQAEAEAFVDFLNIISRSLVESSKCRLKSLLLQDDETYSSSMKR